MLGVLLGDFIDFLSSDFVDCVSSLPKLWLVCTFLPKKFPKTCHSRDYVDLGVLIDLFSFLQVLNLQSPLV